MKVAKRRPATNNCTQVLYRCCFWQFNSISFLLWANLQPGNMVLALVFRMGVWWLPSKCFNCYYLFLGKQHPFCIQSTCSWQLPVVTIYISVTCNLTACRKFTLICECIWYPRVKYVLITCVICVIMCIRVHI